MKRKLTILFLIALATMAAGIPSQGDSLPYPVLPANTDPASLREAYKALSMGEDSYQDAMNAIKALERGVIPGTDVALTPEQKDALENNGLAGLYNARERYLNALAILGLTGAQLDAWEVTHPQVVPCFPNSNVGDCTPEPEIIPTPVLPTPTP
jgi:hypothetical protein